MIDNSELILGGESAIEPAILQLRPDGEVLMNDRCTALMLGVSVEALGCYIREGGGRTSYSLPPLVIKNGIRRRKEFEAITGRIDIDLRAALMYWAWLEGVELVCDDAEGQRVVLVEGDA